MFTSWTRSIIAVFFALISTFGYSQLTITVKSIPTNTPEGAKIYIAGTFTNWNPGDSKFILNKAADQSYQITFTPPVGTLKFKFTQGDWSTVEGTNSGGFIPDRTYNYTGGAKSIELSILGWEGKTVKTSTASINVSILSDTFFIPQLNKKRRIWVYTPPNYNSTSDSFPVLYMHDGQNLFDDLTSFSGEWGVDEALDSLYAAGDKGCIVVGIDNGGGARLDEYSPWRNAQYGGGQGDQYLDFITKTLMRTIEEKYRVLKGPNHTGMMGSSMGALIAMYGGLKYPDIFGKVGSFSSAFWFSDESFKQPSTVDISTTQLHYLIAGAKEGGNQIGDMQKMVNALLANGLPKENVIAVPHSDANHSEWYWRREFPAAYKFLFEKKTSKTNEVKPSLPLTFIQKNNQLYFPELSAGNTAIIIYNLDGKVWTEGHLNATKHYTLNPSLSNGGLVIVQISTPTTKVSKIYFIQPF